MNDACRATIYGTINSNIDSTSETNIDSTNERIDKGAHDSINDFLLCRTPQGLDDNGFWRIRIAAGLTRPLRKKSSFPQRFSLDVRYVDNADLRTKCRDLARKS